MIISNLSKTPIVDLGPNFSDSWMLVDCRRSMISSNIQPVVDNAYISNNIKNVHLQSVSINSKAMMLFHRIFLRLKIFSKYKKQDN